jgi:hypothetical protein
MDFGYVNAYSDDEEIPLRKRKVVRQHENHFEKWKENFFNVFVCQQQRWSYVVQRIGNYVL